MGSIYLFISFYKGFFLNHKTTWMKFRFLHKQKYKKAFISYLWSLEAFNNDLEEAFFVLSSFLLLIIISLGITWRIIEDKEFSAILLHFVVSCIDRKVKLWRRKPLKLSPWGFSSGNFVLYRNSPMKCSFLFWGSKEKGSHRQVRKFRKESNSKEDDCGSY